MKIFVVLGALALLLLPTHFPEGTEILVGRPLPSLTVLRGTIERRSNLASALSNALSPSAVNHLVETARPVYDLARLSVGHPFGLALGPDGLVAAFTYGIDEARILHIVRRGAALTAEIVTRSSEARTETVKGVIASSLFASVSEAGEEDQLALDLAEIFTWDVDFNTEIQKGDSFQVAVEKLYVEGRFSRYGRILAAEFVRGPRTLRAVRFDSSHGPGYYAPDGNPLRKAFLRSPLKFSRISSGFTRRRFHPILNQITTHLGIDFAAPTGTPVQASADGVVTLAGWSGGFGNTVRLRHANGYETLYGHLSRIDVRAQQRVSQGTRIGAVGTTGLSTGSHLDYRMSRNGVFVNPLTVQLPPAEPISGEERPAFEEARGRQLALLSAPASAATTAASTGPVGATIR